MNSVYKKYLCHRHHREHKIGFDTHHPSSLGNRRTKRQIKKSAKRNLERDMDDTDTHFAYDEDWDLPDIDFGNESLYI